MQSNGTRHCKGALSHTPLAGAVSLHDCQGTDAWHRVMLSMILKVVNKQWSPIGREIPGQFKIVYQQTHQSQCEKVISKVGKVYSVLSFPDKALSCLIPDDKRGSCSSIGGMYETGRGAVATYATRNPCPNWLGEPLSVLSVINQMLWESRFKNSPCTVMNKFSCLGRPSVGVN